MAATQPTLLVVDDEASQRQLLGSLVETLGCQVVQAESGEQALELIRENAPALVLLDIRLPGISGLQTLEEIRKMHQRLPVLLITAYADLRQAVAAMKSGADDYLSKPVDLDELRVVIQDLLGLSHEEHPIPRPKLPALPEGLIFQSLAMRRMLETVAVVAPSNVPVLITGESGTGKELIAELIHRWSPRAAGPLVAANCASLPETLIESELFGHSKGAFTGASETRQGVFRAADGGSLFLDEIGEMPLALQPKLLRALETGQISPVGSDRTIEVDVRLIAATNRDLETEVAEGRFRDDLYYRINVVEVRQLPLRDRREDIPLLARRFASEFAGGPVRLSPQAMNCLLVAPWPGNVRELRNAIQRACLLCRGDIILPEHLPPKIAQAVQHGEAADGQPVGRLSQVERATILATLQECGGNRTHAAKKLGISRRALIYKLQAIEAEVPPS
ncbi:MAG: sigma-54-dependent Fis family transcriptional regulator [Planctomycetaceae bacterium]|nr:MAG: sigma-54-dependent Fis family transcriptional regulator [Planctomycetaceae bacterium]TVS19830.1 MAG: sigma-54-dependent Fis family transcriptional regulator [Planctomycetaceae bacterium]